jgi:AraC-like DNA-binding protein
VYWERFDHLRLYISQSMIGECYESIYGHALNSEVTLLDICISNDEPLLRLGKVVQEFARHCEVLGPSFLDALGLSITSRLLVLYDSRRLNEPVKRSGSIAGWRLDRVVEYIETHLSGPIYLSDLSNLVGLNQMYFAAQFRKTMGCPPYAYILQRRVALAQKLLQETSNSLLDIGLSVGFSSQAHFTEAFHRMTGETPARWRSIRLS